MAKREIEIWRKGNNTITKEVPKILSMFTAIKRNDN
jgi:hypothetical protein